MHSASWGKLVLVTVHAKRGKDGMKAAGVLPFFTGIAVRDAWKPYDTFENVAGHALCGAHVLRELVAVTETGTGLDRARAQQAIRMSKLRVKVSGCMRSMTGAEESCAIRSCLATATRQGIGALEALTSDFQGRPSIPGTG